MHDTYALSPSMKDDLLYLLADHRRRAVLSYLRRSTNGVASMGELVNERESPEPSKATDAAVQLQHVILPRLAEYEFINYDRDKGIIRYQHHRSLETLLNTINDL